MSKLPVVTARKIIRVLEKSGFVLKRQTGSHAQFEHTFDSTRHATVAHHKGDVPRRDLASILQQSKITVQEFISLL